MKICVRVAGAQAGLSMGTRVYLLTRPEMRRCDRTGGLKCCLQDLASPFTSGLCRLCVGSTLTKMLPCGPEMAPASFPGLQLQPSCFTPTGARGGLAFHLHEVLLVLNGSTCLSPSQSQWPGEWDALLGSASGSVLQP